MRTRFFGASWSFQPHQHPWHTAAVDLGHDGTQHPAHSGELGLTSALQYDISNVFIHLGLDYQQSQPYQPYQQHQPYQQENNDDQEENNNNEENKDDDEEDPDEGEQDSDEED